jgi:hypothetical protein
MMVNMMDIEYSGDPDIDFVYVSMFVKKLVPFLFALTAGCVSFIYSYIYIQARHDSTPRSGLHNLTCTEISDIDNIVWTASLACVPTWPKNKILKSVVCVDGWKPTISHKRQHVLTLPLVKEAL